MAMDCEKGGSALVCDSVVEWVPWLGAIANGNDCLRLGCRDSLRADR
jgi:hypothetical protein